MALTFNDRSIDAFKSRLRGGGARSNLFEVSFGQEQTGSPAATTLDSSITQGLDFNDTDLMMIKAAGLPASNITEIPVPFRGKTLKIAGDRTFADWSITVLNDTNFKLRNAFERWQNGINNMSDNEGLSNPVDYQVDAFVDQLDRNGNTLKSYTLRGAFPTEVAAIDLNFGTNDEVETFGVTFQYQYFETNTTT